MKKVLTLAFALAVAAGICFLLFSGGITVVVRNVGAEPLRSVIVHVTGRSYPIGDIAHGESKAVEVTVVGESHIELEHATRRRLVIDCYFENGYKGTITAEVTSEKVIAVNSSIQPGPI